MSSQNDAHGAQESVRCGTKEEPTTMANFVITGKAEQTVESSHTVQSTGEVVTKIQLTLNVPGMQDRVLCEMPLDVSPKSNILEQ